MPISLIQTLYSSVISFFRESISIEILDHSTTSLDEMYHELKQKYNNKNLIQYLQSNPIIFYKIVGQPELEIDLYKHLNCAYINPELPKSIPLSTYSNFTTVTAIEKFLAIITNYQVNCMSFRRDFTLDDNLILESLMLDKNHIANFLLKNTAVISSIDKNNKSALYYAIKNKHEFTIKTLIAANLELTEPAVRKIFSLLDKPNDFNNKITESLLNSFAFKEMLFKSLKDGNNQFTNYMLKLGITTNKIDSEGKGALYYAIQSKNEFAIDTIIKNQIDNAYYSYKYTLDLLAKVNYFNDKTIKKLLNINNNFSNFKNELFAIARQAVKNGSLEITKIIIDKKIFITEELNKLIVLASGNQKSNSPEIIEHLLEAGGKCTEALDIAAASGNSNIELIKKICIEIPDNDYHEILQDLNQISAKLYSNLSYYANSLKSNTQKVICNYQDISIYGPSFSLLLTSQKELLSYFIEKPIQGTLKSFIFNSCSTYSKFLFIVPITKFIQYFVVNKICTNESLDKKIESLQSFKEALNFQNDHDQDYYLSSAECRGNDIAKNKFIHLENDWTLCQTTLTGEHHDSMP